MSTVKSKGMKDCFAEFFENPARDTLRKLLEENSGETRYLDFKKDWPSSAALAKHILGMANTESSCIVLGIADNTDGTLDATGVERISDKAKILDGIKKFIPSELLSRLDIYNFTYDTSDYNKIIGKSFQVMMIDFSVEHIPFVSVKDGDGIRAGSIYIRRQGQTSEATHDELQNILNIRIETEHSTSKEIDLKSHIEQLRILYSEIPAYYSMFGVVGQSSVGQLGRGLFSTPNPDAPKESLNQYILRMIEKKKCIIEGCIGAKPLSSQQLKALEMARTLAKEKLP